MAASAQKEKLKIKLTKEENAAYIKLFETYSEEHRSKKDKIIVSAQTVKDLFNKSGLKNTALMRIYELSQQSQKDYLEKIEFVTALKLISIYQNFGSLDNHETLLQAKVSLVKLEGINHNFKESKGIKESNLNSKKQQKSQKQQQASHIYHFSASDQNLNQSHNQPLQKQKPMKLNDPQFAQSQVIKMDKNQQEEFKNDNNCFIANFAGINIQDSDHFGDEQLDLKSSSSEVNITECKTISQGYFGMSSFTQYQLETRSKLPSYDPTRVYIVQRRFNDFEWMHQKLSEDKSYKGLMIPPLPEKKFVGKLDNNFIEKRKEELESYLRVITTHNILKFDQQIFAFLTIEEFEQYRQNPTAFEKVISYANYLPSVKNISISGLQDAVVSVKNTFYEVNEPKELKSQADFTQKQNEIQATQLILQSTCSNIKKQKDLFNESASCLNRVGELFQKIYNLDYTQKQIEENEQKRSRQNHHIDVPLDFYSDKLDEDLDFDNNQKQNKSNKEEASPGLKRNISSSHEYDTLDNIKTDNKIKRYFQQIAQIMEINNPGSQCEIYLREKIQKLQGIIIALEERKTYIKNYATKIEQKYIKNERLSKIEFDSSMKFELNHEIDMLNKDIDDLKISILQQNANLIKETDKLEDTKASQLMKLIIAQGLTLHISFKKIKSFMLENPDFYSVQEQNSDQNNQYLGSQNIIDHTLNQQDSNIVIQDQQQVNEFLNNSRKQSFDQDQRINQNIIGGNNDIYEVGELFQKIYNLDYTQKQIEENEQKRSRQNHHIDVPLDFYSDKLDEDLDFDNNQKQDKSNKEEASPGLKRNVSSSHEYDTLDNIKTDNKIKRYFQQIAQIMEINNPGSQCEIYLREKIQKLQGIIIALEERKTYIKNYATKIEQKYIKNERLSKMQAKIIQKCLKLNLNCSEFDSSMKFELNHEIEMLNKDIDDLKISILQQNANLIKETDKLEDTKASQLMKLIIAQGLTLHISFKKIKSFMLENPDFYSVQEQNSDQNNQYLGSQNIIDHTLNQQDSNIVIQDQQQVNEFLNNSRKQSFDQDQRINQNIIGGNNDIYDQYDNLDD
eukprot:403368732